MLTVVASQVAASEVVHFADNYSLVRWTAVVWVVVEAGVVAVALEV